MIIKFLFPELMGRSKLLQASFYWENPRCWWHINFSCTMANGLILYRALKGAEDFPKRFANLAHSHPLLQRWRSQPREPPTRVSGARRGSVSRSRTLQHLAWCNFGSQDNSSTPVGRLLLRLPPQIKVGSSGIVPAVATLSSFLRIQHLLVLT